MERKINSKLFNGFLALLVFSIAFTGALSVVSASTQIITDPQNTGTLTTGSGEGFHSKLCATGSLISGVDFHDKGGSGDNYVSAIYCYNGSLTTKIIMDPENPGTTLTTGSGEGFHSKLCATGSLISGVDFHDKGGSGDNWVSAIYCDTPPSFGDIKVYRIDSGGDPVDTSLNTKTKIVINGAYSSNNVSLADNPVNYENIPFSYNYQAAVFSTDLNAFDIQAGSCTYDKTQFSNCAVTSFQAVSCDGFWCTKAINKNANSNIVTRVDFRYSPKASSADIKANNSDGPISVSRGSSPVITWSSENTDSCSVSRTGIGIIWDGISGTRYADPITSDTTFTLNCSSPNGPISDDVVVMEESGDVEIVIVGPDSNPTLIPSVSTRLGDLDTTTYDSGWKNYVSSRFIFNLPTISSATPANALDYRAAHVSLNSGSFDGTVLVGVCEYDRGSPECNVSFDNEALKNSSAASWYWSASEIADNKVTKIVFKFNPHSATKLPAPTLSAATGVSCGNYINVWWTAVSGAASYKLYRGTSSSAPGYPPIGFSYAPTGSAPFIDNRIATTYYFVSAIDNDGNEGDLSDAVSAGPSPNCSSGDFSITASPGENYVAQGQDTSVTLKKMSGSSMNVTVAVTSLYGPEGANGTFGTITNSSLQQSATGLTVSIAEPTLSGTSDTSNVSVTTDSDTPLGRYRVAITGSLSNTSIVHDSTPGDDEAIFYVTVTQTGGEPSVILASGDGCYDTTIDWYASPSGSVTGFKIYSDFGDSVFVTDIDADDSDYFDGKSYTYTDLLADTAFWRSYTVGALYQNESGGISEKKSNQIFVPGCGQTIISVDAWPDYQTIHYNEDEIFIENVTYKLESGNIGPAFVRFSLPVYTGNDTPLDQPQNCDGNFDVTGHVWDIDIYKFSARDFGTGCEYFVDMPLSRNQFGSTIQTVQGIFTNLLNMNNINTQYYFRANVANSLKAFDGETISGYCAAIYNSSAPFSHLECNNDKLNLLGEEEYSQDTLSVIRVNNFDPTALNDKDSIFAKVAYADYYGATSDDISDEDEPWLQAFNAYTDTICGTGNWTSSVAAVNQFDFSCGDTELATAKASDDFYVDVTAGDPSIVTNQPSCKSQGEGVIELYIVPGDSSASEYKIGVKNSASGGDYNYKIYSADSLPLQSDGSRLFVQRDLKVFDDFSGNPIKYDFAVSEHQNSGAWSNVIETTNKRASACDKTDIMLKCDGDPLYPSPPGICVSLYNQTEGNFIRLSVTPTTFWDTCTPTSASPTTTPPHTGWNSASWVVSSPSQSVVGDIGSNYKDFSASGGQYLAGGLTKKEYTFNWTCNKSQAVDSPNPQDIDGTMSVSVCVKPPAVTPRAVVQDSSTVIVTWDKPKEHKTFGLWYKLIIDGTTVITIDHNAGAFGDGDGECDSLVRDNSPYGQCIYRHKNLTAESIHSYQLNILAEYDECDPGREIKTETPPKVVKLDPCLIDLKIGHEKDFRSYFEWKIGESNPDIYWATSGIPDGATCQVSGNIDGFSGTVLCSSGKTGIRRLVTLDLQGSSLEPGLYNTSLNYVPSGSAISCQGLASLKIVSDYSLSAVSPIELVALGTSTGKTLTSQKSTITINRSAGFSEAVDLAIRDIEENDASIRKDPIKYGKFNLNLVRESGSRSTLEVSSNDSNNPIPDGTYDIIIEGVSDTGIKKTTSITLRVRTIAPEYNE
ncbi:MAG TPA: hypothetical protein VJI33_03510 [Candidatus Paceibacterota bacterium]